MEETKRDWKYRELKEAKFPKLSEIFDNMGNLLATRSVRSLSDLRTRFQELIERYGITEGEVVSYFLLDFMETFAEQAGLPTKRTMTDDDFINMIFMKEVKDDPIARLFK
jgi:antitoxin component of RelBE/YafQ-DinJ toxin-antitoxin module